MITFKVQKEDIHNQLWPISVDDTLIYKSDLFEMEGLFGIKNNVLTFIPFEDLAEEFNVSIPETMDEVLSFLTSAEYILQRIMMTPDLNISGFPGEFEDTQEERQEVMNVFSDFVNGYNRNANALDRVKNGW